MIVLAAFRVVLMDLIERIQPSAAARRAVVPHAMKAGPGTRLSGEAWYIIVPLGAPKPDIKRSAECATLFSFPSCSWR
jgi:hypothetical protein